MSDSENRPKTDHANLDEAICHFQIAPREDGRPRRLHPGSQTRDGLDPWTFRHAFEGTQIFGATGAGKTSGSGRSLAMGMLRKRLDGQHRFGGLVLTAKPSDVVEWKEYARLSDREDDLVLFRPNKGLGFNFLEYEYNRPQEEGGGLTHNVVSLFLATMSTGGKPSGSDPYWADALRELLTHTVDLAALGTRDDNGRSQLDLMDLMKIIRSAPQTRSEADSPKWRQQSRCWELINAANDRSRRGCLDHGEEANAARRKDLQETIDYWLIDFPSLAERTRSVVVSSFTSKAAGLIRTPLRELFCCERSKQSADVLPERTHQGKIIVLCLPVKLFGEVGRFAQILYKTVWQRAVERRDLKTNPNPVFLWADESQYFISTEDTLFQQTARSKRAATVYLTQNIPNYHTATGGDKSMTDSLLGNLQTKIFHANGDPTTNEWAERLFGNEWTPQESQTHGSGGRSVATSESRNPVILSSKFTSLKKGGPDGRVEAYVFRGGQRFNQSGRRYMKAMFTQEEAGK